MAQHRAEVSVHTKAKRLRAVRRFAEYVRTLEPRTEVPSTQLLPDRRERHVPRLYTSDEIQALMKATQKLRGPLKPDTYATLIGLLAVTGLRVGEAIGLDCSDINEREGLLVIRNAKFGKSREVPCIGPPSPRCRHTWPNATRSSPGPGAQVSSSPETALGFCHRR